MRFLPATCDWPRDVWAPSPRPPCDAPLAAVASQHAISRAVNRMQSHDARRRDAIGTTGSIPPSDIVNERQTFWRPDVTTRA